MEQYPLKDDIWWVGAIDWDVRDFHGYETPRGTTYNAYLIIDEKVTLVDGVRRGLRPGDAPPSDELLRPRAIEYLVVNHIEMDHSGAIPWLVERVRPVNIFAPSGPRRACCGTTPPKASTDWDIRWSAPATSSSWAATRCSFLEAPMLHWPDSMFTYVKEAKVLLPNDAFGQHLATLQALRRRVRHGRRHGRGRQVLRQHPHAVRRPHREDAAARSGSSASRSTSSARATASSGAGRRISRASSTPTSGGRAFEARPRVTLSTTPCGTRPRR